MCCHTYYHIWHFIYMVQTQKIRGKGWSCREVCIFTLLGLKLRIIRRSPCLDWYVSQRPPGTKALCDNTTGLCHLCEAAKTNFTTLVKAVKRLCDCGTNSFSNWFSVCATDSDEEDGEDQPCSCLSCELNIFFKYWNNWFPCFIESKIKSYFVKITLNL